MKRLQSFLVFSDLWPYDLGDRAYKALVLAALVGLTIVFSKHLSLPETALSAYLILFAVRPGAFETIAIAVALMFAALLAVGLLTLALMATSGQPALRIPLMFIATFGCFYVASASKEGAIITTAGMIFFEVLSGLDLIPYPGLILRGMFWLVAIILLPMALLILAQLILGRLPLKFVRNELDLRQRVLGGTTDGARAVQKRVRSFLLAGARDVSEPLKQIRKSGFLPGSISQLEALSDDTARNLARAAVQTTPQDAAPLAQTDPAQSEPGPEASAEPTAQPDIRFALVATLAVAISYFVFLLLKWPEIHTITITTFLISISTKFETFYKARLRMGGFLVGAVVTVATLLWIIPQINDASQLGLVCAVVLFPAAWIALSNEVVSYLGLQVALVFLLTVVNSSGPEVDLAIAWGRFCGILLGTLIVTVTFQTFLTDKPEPRFQERLAFLKGRNAARNLAQKDDGNHMLALTDQVAELRRQIYVAGQDPTLSAGAKSRLNSLWIEANRLFLDIVKCTRPLPSSKAEEGRNEAVSVEG